MSLFPALTGVAGLLPLPNTAPTPAAGETVKASDVQLAVQALLDQDATIVASYLTVGLYSFTTGFGSYAADVTSATFVDAGSISVDIADCEPGDFLYIDFSYQCDLALVAGHTAQVRIHVTEDVSGTPVAAALADSTRRFTSGAAAFSAPSSISTFDEIDNGGTARIKVQACVPETTGADHFRVDGFARLRVIRHRPWPVT